MADEVITISNEIRDGIKLLRQARDSLKARAQEKAESVGRYERELAKTIIRLRNGEVFEVDGFPIHNPPATITEKIARGICYQFKIKADVAESAYKGAVLALDATKTEINALQSLYRHLDEG
jgi:hypothetical protein